MPMEVAVLPAVVLLSVLSADPAWLSGWPIVRSGQPPATGTPVLPTPTNRCPNVPTG